MTKKIAIMGAGAWGTALAIVCHTNNNHTLVWSRNNEVVTEINQTHQNTTYLPGVALPKSLEATSQLSKIISADVLLLVVPAQTLRANCLALKDSGLSATAALVICCKGIEEESYMLMHEVVADILPDNPVAILSGPNFAGEIAGSLPAAATLACADEVLGMELLELIGTKKFRPYYSSDIIGVGVGGAVKNVLAIACGICVGNQLGENAMAALVTRGIAEISRLCVALGGKPETMMGLSGIGDIMLTCSSQQSRNMSLGLEIGKGKSFEQIQSAGGKLTEGVATTRSVTKLAKAKQVELPICEAMYRILYKNSDVKNEIYALLERPLKTEV